MWSRGVKPASVGTGRKQHDPSAGKSQTTDLFAAIPLTAKKNEPSSQELCVAGKDKLL